MVGHGNKGSKTQKFDSKVVASEVRVGSHTTSNGLKKGTGTSEM